MINVTNLTKIFKNKVIFEDTSFVLPDKGLFILDSDNGTGKTTLFKILCGIDKEYEGKISEKEKPIPDNYFDYIDQKQNYITFLSVKDNYELKDFLFKDSKIEEDESIKALINRKNVNTLSEGEKMLILLSRAFKSNSKIVLLDEITACLDETNTKIIFEKIKELAKVKLVLLATHDSRIDVSNLNKIDITSFKVVVSYSNEHGKTSNENISTLEQKPRKTPLKLFFKYLKCDIFMTISALILLCFLGIVLSAFSLVTSVSRTNVFIKSYEEGDTFSIFEKAKSYKYGDLTFEKKSSGNLSLQDIEDIENNFDISGYYNDEVNFLFNNNGNDYVLLSQSKFDKIRHNENKNIVLKDNKLIVKVNGFNFELDYKIAKNNLIEKLSVDYEYFLSGFNYRSFGTNSLIFDKDFQALDSKLDFLSDKNISYFYSLDKYKEDFDLTSLLTLKDGEILVGDKYKDLAGKTLEVIDLSSFELYGDQNSYINLKGVFPNGARIIYDSSLSKTLGDSLFLVNDNTAKKMLNTMSFVSKIDIKIDNLAKLANFLITGNTNEKENIFRTNFDTTYGKYNMGRAEEFGARDINFIKNMFFISVFCILVMILYFATLGIYFYFDKVRHKQDFNVLHSNGLKAKYLFIFRLVKLIIFFAMSFIPGFIINFVNPDLVGFIHTYNLANPFSFTYLTFIYLLITLLVLILILVLLNKDYFKGLKISIKRKSEK